MSSTARGFSAAAPPSFYSLTEPDATGSPVDFERFKGKVCYIVNVASK